MSAGVAYNNLSYGTENIRWIQRWPGRSQANENKVPSILTYQYGHDKPSSWGFQVDSQVLPAPSVTREWFKRLLDPENLRIENERNPSHPVSHDSVKKWITDSPLAGLSSKQLRQLDIVSGENVISAAIDYDFELLARERLKEASTRAVIALDVEQAA